MGYLFSISKSATEDWLKGFEGLLLVCGLVLAFGAAGEYLEDHDRLPGWMKWSRKPKLIFVWMVALSLFGEFAGDAGVFVFSGRLQSIQDRESQSLRVQTEQEIEKRINLEKIVVWEGPRYMPILWAEKQFRKELSAFPGQRFRVSVCTMDFSPPSGDLRQTEIGQTWEAIEFVLHQAKWELAGGRLEWMENNCLSTSIAVRTPKEATKSTCDAALALQSALTVALSDLAFVYCDGTQWKPDPGPDVIEIHIGKHPSRPIAGIAKAK
jgi:hypothetical protein